jgi:hypothetical protein
MTFAELLLIALLGYGLYCALRPIQRRLERYFLSVLSGGKPRRERTVIDIDREGKRPNGS